MLDKVQRDFLKTRFSRCMLYRHNAAIRTDWNLVIWDNSLYLYKLFELKELKHKESSF